MGNVGTRGFAIATFLITTVIAGVLIANLVYFNMIRNGKVVSTGEATSMLIISAILFVFTIILWIWALSSLFVSNELKAQVVNSTTSYLGSSSYGYLTPEHFTQATPAMVVGEPGSVAVANAGNPNYA